MVAVVFVAAGVVLAEELIDLTVRGHRTGPCTVEINVGPLLKFSCARNKHAVFFRSAVYTGTALSPPPPLYNTPTPPLYNTPTERRPRFLGQIT